MKLRRRGGSEHYRRGRLGVSQHWNVPSAYSTRLCYSLTAVFQDRLSLFIPLQAIVLSADGPLPKRRRRINTLPPETLGADEELFTCMARGTYTPSQAEGVKHVFLNDGERHPL